MPDVAEIFMIDSKQWTEASDNPRDRKSWLVAKTPFTEKVFKAAASDVNSSLRTDDSGDLTDIA
jgi:hypothetical protein